MIDKKMLVRDLNLVREKSPLIHNITNFVVMNNTANALLAIGASPVMAHAIEEVEDMVSIASALVINMGTLSSTWVNAMILAGKAAKKRGIPIVFDPVGVGATSYRNKVAANIIEQCSPTIIRGNASEIMALVSREMVTKGVDSTTSSSLALDSARFLAKQSKSVVVISGAIDYITDGEKVLTVSNGSGLMPKVTGMGCTATAITGAFAAIDSNVLWAAAHAMAVMGVVGEIATAISKGPASLQLNFIDTLYSLTGEDLDKYYRE